jgi:hypothetical protein
MESPFLYSIIYLKMAGNIGKTLNIKIKKRLFNNYLKAGGCLQ